MRWEVESAQPKHGAAANNREQEEAA